MRHGLLRMQMKAKKKKAMKKPTNSKHVMKGKGRWPKC